MGKVLKFIVLVVVLLAAAYVAGFWPQRERIGTLQSENVALSQRVEAAEARVRGGALLGELLSFKEVVQDMNYGQARGMSSPFFEHVRAEAARTPDAGLKAALESINVLRDPVTVGLTQGDASALSHLRDAEGRLRRALGYPPPPPSMPSPAAAVPLALPSPSAPLPPS